MKTALLLVALLSCGAFRLAAADAKVSAAVSVGAADPAPAVNAKGKGKGPPPWAPAHGKRAKFSYQYFPAVEVYRRPSDGVWFYLENGRWTMGARLPVGLKVDFAAAVRLEMDSDKPFAFHADVKAAHPKPASDRPGQGPETGKSRGKGKGRN